MASTEDTWPRVYLANDGRVVAESDPWTLIAERQCDGTWPLVMHLYHPDHPERVWRTVGVRFRPQRLAEWVGLLLPQLVCGALAGVEGEDTPRAPECPAAPADTAKETCEQQERE